MAIDKHAGMRVDGLLSDEFVNQLCHAAEGSFGTIIVTARQAVYRAHDRADFDGRVLLEDFAGAYAAERKCVAAQNVFLVDNWEEIVPGNSRQRETAGVDETAKNRSRKSKGAA